MGITTVFHIFAPSRRGDAAEIGFLGAERATIPAFGPSLDSGFRGFAVATAGRNLAPPRAHRTMARPEDFDGTVRVLHGNEAAQPGVTGAVTVR